MDITKEMLAQHLKDKLLYIIVSLGKKNNYTIKSIKFRKTHIEILGKDTIDNYNFGVYIYYWADFNQFVIKDDKLDSTYKQSEDKFSKAAGIPVTAIENKEGVQVEIPNPTNWKNNALLWHARLFFLGLKKIREVVKENNWLNSPDKDGQMLDKDHVVNIDLLIYNVNMYGNEYFFDKNNNEVTIDEI